MIDFLRVKLIDRDLMLHNLVKDKHNYQVIGKYNHSLGEQEYPIRSKRENLFINITEKGATIENSLHKYFNQIVSNENHNYNDFYFCDILFALDVLEEETNYPLKQTILTNLEFGFNIELNINPTLFLENNVLMYNFRSPCYDPKNEKGKKIKKFTYTEYEIKIYNKSLQYKLPKNILRIEVKYTSKKQLNKLGIYNLSDLKKSENINALMQDFLRKYDKLLIVDAYNGNNQMSKRERDFMTHCTHPNYWIELSHTKHANTISNQRMKLYKLIEKFNLDSWKNNLRKDIISKFNQLMTSDCHDEAINLLDVV